MTEDEAKDLWCPFARVAAGAATSNGADLVAVQPVFNRVAIEHVAAGITPHASKCIASRCMAWRTTKAFFNKETNEEVPPTMPFQVGKFERRDTGSGYCGLAGKP